MNMDINKYEELEKLRIDLGTKRLNLVAGGFLNKNKVIEQYGGGVVPTRYGFIKDNISDYDLKKVQEIEDLIHEYLIVNTASDLLRELENHRGLEDETKGYIENVKDDLRSKYSHADNEHRKRFLEDIDYLIEPLKQKGIYIPKAKAGDLLSAIVYTLAKEGLYDEIDYNIG